MRRSNLGLDVTKHSKVSTIAMAAAFLVVGAVTSASATVINFDTYFPETNPESDIKGIGEVITVDGFQFDPGLTGQYIQWSIGTPQNADPKGHTLSHNYAGTTTTMTKVGGGLFDLLSIDFADIYNEDFGGDVKVGWDSGSSTLTLAQISGLQTFALNLTGISYFTITPISTQFLWIQFDNIVTDEAGPSPVPVPGALPLLASAMIGFGVIACRKRKVNASG